MPSQKKKCKSDEILNRETNRCVKKTGIIGKKIIKDLKDKKKKSKKKECKDDEILNTETNRCVKRSGTIGKRLVEIEKNKSISKKRRTRSNRRSNRRSNNSLNNIETAKIDKIKKATVICEKGKILNPKTNRCVRINGPIGRSIRDKINNIKEIVKELIHESNTLTKRDIKNVLRDRNVVFEGYGITDIIIDSIDEILKENVSELLENDDIITRKDIKRELDKRNVLYSNRKLKTIINEVTNEL
jgi:hypothetical protein